MVSRCMGSYVWASHILISWPGCLAPSQSARHSGAGSSVWQSTGAPHRWEC